MPARPPGRGTPLPPPRFSLWLALLKVLKYGAFYLLPFLTAAFVVYVGYQDYVVRQHFEGKRWSLPAHVYADSVDIYSGAGITLEKFQWLLDQLKYRRDPELSSQGSYFREDNEIIVRTRDFQFPEKAESSRIVRVLFGDYDVKKINDLGNDGGPELLRMEPVQIGSFYPALKEDRVLIELKQAPDLLLKGLYAVEDRDFPTHVGVSLRGMLRAVYANLRAGGIVQGGSTLTQQLVKNFFLSSERTWWRKLNEVVMALILEVRFSKDDILEAYLNEIYLGQDGARAIHGFGLASQFYFSRSLEELDLHHIALLVALVRGPSFYDPFKMPDKARKRRELVLQEMAAENYITPEQAAAAAAAPLDVVTDPHQAISRFPAFMDLVKRQLEKEYRADDLSSEGLRIFTTLDVFAQRQLEQAVTGTLKKLEAQTKVHELEAAAILTRRDTGEIAALLGSRDPLASGYNRALDASRQIGSLYKPVVYLTALQAGKGYTVISRLRDQELHLRTGGIVWNPKNYDQKEHGSVPMHYALAHSLNLATIRLGMDVGVEATVETLRRLGVDRKVDAVPSVLLGTIEMSPFEVAKIYQTFANVGFAAPLHGIGSVVAQTGATLTRYGVKVRQSADPAATYLLDYMLERVMRDGTGKPAYALLPKDFDVAGKTGTTNDLRDSWFAGFTGDYVGVVWIGRDDNRPAKLTGAQGALKVWSAAISGLGGEPLQLAAPSDIDWAWVDRASGRRTGSDCPTASRIPFVTGTAPNYGACSGAEDGAGQEPAEEDLF